MANGQSANERATVTLHVVSPCEHGIEHDILELSEGADFAVLGCRDSKGHPRSHHVSKERYPITRRRR